MKPTEKHPEIDTLLKMVTGRDRKDSIRVGVCSTCGGDAFDFRDGLSRKEYAISGMCQRCQDSVFD